MKKRILFFIETGGPGGAEQVVLQLLEGFASLGHTVFLSTLRTGWLTQTALERGFQYHQIHSQNGSDLMLPFKISKLIKSLDVDVLHTHLLDSNFYGALAAKIARVPHVGTEHGDVHHIDKKKFVKAKLLIASSGKSRITAVSDFSAQRLTSLGVKPDKVSVIPNPVSEPVAAAQRAEARDSLGIVDDWLWIHVGNLRPVKDQATLIKGFANSICLTDNPQKLLLIGDGQEKEKLNSLVNELSLTGEVLIIGHSDEVAFYLSAGDGFLMSSISESMPMALLEAISYSLYPICSSVGGIPEILSSEQLFPAGDFKNLGDLCTKVVDNQDHYRTLAKEFSTRMRSERSLEVVCNKYLELYG